MMKMKTLLEYLLPAGMAMTSDDDFVRRDYRLLQEDALKHFSSTFVDDLSAKELNKYLHLC